MPRINLLSSLTTRGIDIKSNPLLLGNAKLHVATNLVFDEGTIRTRPGFRYFPMGIEGKFQGACRYDPTKGLSVSTFSDTEAGLVFVVDGAVFYKADNHCETKRISTQVFCVTGDVNIFQAENYIILTNPNTPTYWWDGTGDIVKSPGMSEQDWNDPDMPEIMLEPELPVADFPDCLDDSGINVNFLVVNHITGETVTNYTWTVYKNNVRAFYGVSEDGRFTFSPRPGDYTYTIEKDGYTAITKSPITITGEEVEVIFEECMPPHISIIGTRDVIVRLTQIDLSQVQSVRVQMFGHLDDDLRVVYIAPNGVRTTLQDLKRNVGTYTTFNGVTFLPWIDTTITRAQALSFGAQMISGGSIEVSAFDGWDNAYKTAPYNLHVEYSTGTVVVSGGVDFQGTSNVPQPPPVHGPTYYTDPPTISDYYVMGTHLLTLP